MVYRHPDSDNLDAQMREAKREQERQERACPRVCRLNEALLPITLRMDWRDPRRHVLGEINHELLYRLDLARDITEEEEAQGMYCLDYARQEIAG